MQEFKRPSGLFCRIHAVVWTALIVWMALTGTGAAQINFHRFYVIGDSYSAGFMHGTLMEDFQPCSFAALLVQQAGLGIWTDFTMPRVSRPGVPGVLRLERGFPLPSLLQAAGSGVNLLQSDPNPYHNLAIPGASTDQLLQAFPLGFDPYFDMVLRGRGSVVDQIERVHPDSALMWIGINEGSPALVFGFVFPGLTITRPEDFAATYERVYRRVRIAVQGPLVVMTIPDITESGFCHYVQPYLFDLRTGKPVVTADGRRPTMLGPRGEPLDPASCVIPRSIPWILAGYGIPEEYGGNGLGLPGGVVLTPNEIARMRLFISEYNQVIQGLAAGDAQTYVFDVAALFDRWYSDGIDVAGIHLSLDYPYGGFWALDAFHPGPIGHALIANELITFMNREVGTDLPLIDLAPFLRGQVCALPNLTDTQTSWYHIDFSDGSVWMPR